MSSNYEKIPVGSIVYQFPNIPHKHSGDTPDDKWLVISIRLLNEVSAVYYEEKEVITQ